MASAYPRLPRHVTTGRYSKRSKTSARHSLTLRGTPSSLAARRNVQPALDRGATQKVFESPRDEGKVAEANEFRRSVKADQVSNQRKDRDVGNGVVGAGHPDPVRQVHI